MYLFACVHNAGRSQMAAAFFNQLADSMRARAISAGTHPAEQVHPVVVDVMRELGIELAAQLPQKLTPALAEQAAILITLGCGEECPFVPGLRLEDWPLTDPRDQSIEAVREIREAIRQRVLTLLTEDGLLRA